MWVLTCRFKRGPSEAPEGRVPRPRSLAPPPPSHFSAASRRRGASPSRLFVAALGRRGAGSGPTPPREPVPAAGGAPSGAAYAHSCFAFRCCYSTLSFLPLTHKGKQRFARGPAAHGPHARACALSPLSSADPALADSPLTALRRPAGRCTATRPVAGRRACSVNRRDSESGQNVSRAARTEAEGRSEPEERCSVRLTEPAADRRRRPAAVAHSPATPPSRPRPRANLKDAFEYAFGVLPQNTIPSRRTLLALCVAF